MDESYPNAGNMFDLSYQEVFFSSMGKSAANLTFYLLFTFFLQHLNFQNLLTLVWPVLVLSLISWKLQNNKCNTGFELSLRTSQNAK